MPKAPSEEWLKEWEEKIELVLASQRYRSPEMAREMQKVVEEVEAEAKAQGIELPKHSHRFAPENLWPDEKSGDTSPKAGIE